MEEDGEKVVGLTQNHINAITCLLYFYEQHLWNFTAPSVKRTKQILEIQLLVVKIQLLSIGKIGTLTPDEVGYIDAAIRVFVSQATDKITQSASRDGVLESCEELRAYLRQIFTRSNGHYL
jgi:hypothetical protein